RSAMSVRAAVVRFFSGLGSRFRATRGRFEAGMTEQDSGLLMLAASGARFLPSEPDRSLWHEWHELAARKDPIAYSRQQMSQAGLSAFVLERQQHSRTVGHHL